MRRRDARALHRNASTLQDCRALDRALSILFSIHRCNSATVRRNGHGPASADGWRSGGPACERSVAFCASSIFFSAAGSHPVLKRLPCLSTTEIPLRYARGFKKAQRGSSDWCRGVRCHRRRETTAGQAFTCWAEMFAGMVHRNSDTLVPVAWGRSRRSVVANAIFSMRAIGGKSAANHRENCIRHRRGLGNASSHRWLNLCLMPAGAGGTMRTPVRQRAGIRLPHSVTR